MPVTVIDCMMFEAQRTLPDIALSQARQLGKTHSVMHGLAIHAGYQCSLCGDPRPIELRLVPIERA